MQWCLDNTISYNLNVHMSGKTRERN